ncbi:NAD(P)(+) transhydrogenase (Re/Si-specific) subunit beta [Sphingobium estronivorans]|uniref:NAD(P)(+) transhydrogenase (Re/Si-specific) subunit beta n=1 Tax=Sphingobium estronivorans TaxID=1577690 RepID=UPI00123BAA6D|nr:NAD(P)(+) transhydrogenase (Re/Si-specific) subunit beta [Sphingobium estronivorans]
MEPIDPTIAAGWSVAALLFGLALLASLDGGLRRGANLMMAGMMVIGAVTLYSHDVMAMPQICAALITGGAIGLALGQGVPRSAIPALLTGLVGQAGLAAVFVGGAAWRNPHAFGLLDEATDRLLGDAAIAMAATVALGAMACAGAAAILWRGTAWQGERRPGLPLFAAAMLVATGGTMAGFVASPGSAGLLVSTGVALLAGWGLARWAIGAGAGPAMALVGGLAGWAVAASAFLLENTGMAVAGGLAGAAGSLLGLRLCGRAGRKGLADARRRP